MAQAWVNISECARMYGRDRKWVYNRIKKHNITTEKLQGSTERRFQIVDFIAHCGEPEQNGAPDSTGQHTQTAQGSTSDDTTEIALMRQEIQFLNQRITELKADRAERQARETQWNDERRQLQATIDRTTLALPKPNQRGIVQRVMGWWQGPAKSL